MRFVRPISVLGFWTPEGLTRAESNEKDKKKIKKEYDNRIIGSSSISTQKRIR